MICRVGEYKVITISGLLDRRVLFYCGKVNSDVFSIYLSGLQINLYYPVTIKEITLHRALFDTGHKIRILKVTPEQLEFEVVE